MNVARLLLFCHLLCSSLVMFLGVYFITILPEAQSIDQAILMSIPFIRLFSGITDLRLHEKINKNTTRHSRKVYAASELFFSGGIALIAAMCVVPISYELSPYVFIMFLGYKSSTSSTLYAIRYNRQFYILFTISFSKLLSIALTYSLMEQNMTFNEYILCTEIISIYYLLFGFNNFVFKPIRLIKVCFQSLRTHLSINLSKSLRSNIEILALVLLKTEDALVLRKIVESSIKLSQPFASILTYFRNNIYYDLTFYPRVYGLIFLVLGGGAEALIFSGYYIFGFTLLTICFMYMSAFLRAIDLRQRRSSNRLSCILLFDLLVIFTWISAIIFYEMFSSIKYFLVTIPLVLIPANYILVFRSAINPQ